MNDGGFDTGCLPDSSTVAPCGTESDPGVRIYVGTHYTDCFNPSTIQGDVDMLVTLAECLAMNPTRPLNC